MREEQQSINIQTATEADYSAIREIAYETWPHAFKRILSEDQIDYMLEMMYSISSLQQQTGEKGHRFLLASDRSGFLGFASYELDYKGLRHTKIHKIYVLPKAQGKGAGRALIQKVEDIAHENQSDVLCLNVNRENPSITFYEKLGFAISGREDIPIGNGFLMEDFIMQKEL